MHTLLVLHGTLETEVCCTVIAGSAANTQLQNPPCTPTLGGHRYSQLVQA